MKSERNEVVKQTKIQQYSTDEWVDTYDSRYETPGLQMINAIEQRIVARYAHGKILDGGTGTGRFSIPLAQQGNAVNSFDASGKMLQMVRTKTAPLSLKHPLRLIQGDLQFLPFDSESFDTVVSIHVLRHIPQFREILLEYARVLKPGGYLVFEMRSGDHVKLCKKLMETLGISEPKPVVSHGDIQGYADYRELKSLLESQGLKVRQRYTISFFRGHWFSYYAPVKRFVAWAISSWLAKRVYPYIELYLLRYLPTSLSYHYILVAQKGAK